MISLKRSLVIIFSILFVYSCNDFLNRPPLDAISSEDYWTTTDDLRRYVLQFYPEFPSHGNYGEGYGYPVTNADNAINATPNEVLNGERGITGGRWIDDWSQIRSVNIFFENYQKCEDDFESYKHYLGEAHFFKAWFYFELVKKYGDLPWYSTPLVPGSEEELMRPRDPRTVVVDSILANLDQAIEFLNYRSEAGNNRINKEAALAFKTRVGLFEGSWQKYHANTAFGTEGADPDKYFQESVDAAEELMNGDYSVGIYNGNSDNAYYELFGLADMSSINEVLLYRAYNQEDGLSNDMQYATIFATAELGATWSLITSYLDKNGEPYDYLNLSTTAKGNAFLTRIADDVDPRLHATIWAPGDLQVTVSGQTFEKPRIDEVGLTLNPTGFQIKKGSNPNALGAGKGGGGNSETGYIIFRYGEVLLNYAEALYELEGRVANEALNQLRYRAGMPEFSVNSQTADPHKIDYGYSVSDELYGIRRERRIELALEGHRADDYKRWAAHSLFKEKRPKGYPFEQNEFPEYNPPLDENGLIDYYQTNLPDGYGFRVNQDYLNSLPVEELTLNPNLDQNPGWE